MWESTMSGQEEVKTFFFFFYLKQSDISRIANKLSHGKPLFDYDEVR